MDVLHHRLQPRLAVVEAVEVRGDFHRIDWHWHHELEFIYVAEGAALCLIVLIEAEAAIISSEISSV